MKVRKCQCDTCPFREPISDDELAEVAAVPPEQFPCHEDDLYGDLGIQCRGHWGQRRRFANRHGADELARITGQWQPDMSANA